MKYLKKYEELIEKVEGKIALGTELELRSYCSQLTSAVKGLCAILDGEALAQEQLTRASAFAPLQQGKAVQILEVTMAIQPLISMVNVITETYKEQLGPDDPIFTHSLLSKTITLNQFRRIEKSISDLNQE